MFAEKRIGDGKISYCTIKFRRMDNDERLEKTSQSNKTAEDGKVSCDAIKFRRMDKAERREKTAQLSKW